LLEVNMLLFQVIQAISAVAAFWLAAYAWRRRRAPRGAALAVGCASAY
jgi:hypothetical protein